MNSRHTLAVITEAHLGLTQTNCVFSLAYTIEFLQLGLVNTLDELLVFCDLYGNRRY